ncbi:hypothetical protein LC612_42630 [Nostoc sp. CHAB 5834]|nr:hypothetical protein [Nostoc sp. CHAB 5834]
MWDRQNNVSNKEQVAFITDKGIVWLDDAGNTQVTGNLPAGTNFPTDQYGRRLINMNGELHTVTGIIHTHPIGGLIGLSGDDIAVSQQYNVPIYAITTGGIFKGTGNGSVSTVSSNYRDAFDCALTYGYFGL